MSNHRCVVRPRIVLRHADGHQQVQVIVASDATDEMNFGHYANAEVDSLLAVATGALRREEALPVWHRLQEVLQADPPAAYLLYPSNLVGVSKRLQNVRPHLLSPVNNLVEWWIASVSAGSNGTSSLPIPSSRRGREASR